MRLSPLAEDKVKDIDYNDPKCVYNDLKQEFEPDTAANRLDKLNKFLNALQSNEESTVRYGGRVRGLLHEWSELWPASYLLLKFKEELWMHVVLRGLGPSFQHIRNGYAGAEKQDAATLERLLDSNNAMDSATDLHTAFAAHAPPASALNPSGCLLCPRPASAFDYLWCETNGNYFTEECRNIQCSKEQRLANHSQPKTPASKGKPQQAKAADAALAEFAGEASRIHSPSDLITSHS